jgi:hypothetical protein
MNRLLWDDIPQSVKDALELRQQDGAKEGDHAIVSVDGTPGRYYFRRR